MKLPATMLEAVSSWKTAGAAQDMKPAWEKYLKDRHAAPPDNCRSLHPRRLRRWMRKSAKRQRLKPRSPRTPVEHGSAPDTAASIGRNITLDDTAGGGALRERRELRRGRGEG